MLFRALDIIARTAPAVRGWRCCCENVEQGVSTARCTTWLGLHLRDPRSARLRKRPGQTSVNLAQGCTATSVVKTAKSMREAASQIGDLAGGEQQFSAVLCELGRFRWCPKAADDLRTWWCWRNGGACKRGPCHEQQTTYGLVDSCRSEISWTEVIKLPMAPAAPLLVLARVLCASLLALP